MYELPHELPNDLRVRTLGNQDKSGKSQNCIGTQLCAHSPPAEILFLKLVLKKYAKGCIKKFWFCLTLPDFLIFSKDFAQAQYQSQIHGNCDISKSPEVYLNPYFTNFLSYLPCKICISDHCVFPLTTANTQRRGLLDFTDWPEILFQNSSTKNKWSKPFYYQSSVALELVLRFYQTKVL